MKVLAKTEELSLRAYVAFKAHISTSRGQGSLEYIAIAIAIVIVIAAAFALFANPIAQQTSCILNSVNGSAAAPSVTLPTGTAQTCPP